MRYESSVTSLSWIPSEAVTGVSRAAFDSGFTHYDDPPPGELDDIEELQAADRFRFANRLRAWIEVDDGRITGGGYSGGGLMGATTLRLAALGGPSRGRRRWGGRRCRPPCTPRAGRNTRSPAPAAPPATGSTVPTASSGTSPA